MGDASTQQSRRCIREITGQRIEFDAEGFLQDADDWSEPIARVLAAEAGLEQLTNEHWRVLRFMRHFYDHHGRAPLNKTMRTDLGMRISQIEALFPGGIKYGARRLAGLPNPKSCM